MDKVNILVCDDDKEIVECNRDIFTAGRVSCDQGI